MLLDSGVDIEQKNNAEWTALQTACYGGYLQAVKLLIEHGADITARTPSGSTCLILAAKIGDPAVVSYLLEQDSCPIDKTDASSFSALHRIVRLNTADLVSKLICKGVDINAQNRVCISVL